MNIEEKNVEIICDIVNYYTKEQQVMQSIEEMSELTKELVKNINRGKDNKKEIKGEIVDVTIMLAQLIIIYEMDGEELVNEMKNKLDRQKERMEEEIRNVKNKRTK